jgi:hypothetical protein
VDEDEQLYTGETMTTEDPVRPMNTEVKAKWLAALRDGSYRQAMGKLHASGGYCCLGVLCDLVDNTKWEDNPTTGCKEYDRKIYMPPQPLLEQVGLHEDVTDRVSKMNDDGSSFAEIADYLERHT